MLKLILLSMHWVHTINENFEQNILIEFKNEKKIEN